MTFIDRALHRFCGALLALALPIAASNAHAGQQEFAFDTGVNTVVSNSHSNGHADFRRAKLVLHEDEIGATVKILGIGVNDCYWFRVDAKVERTALTTTVFPAQRTPGCAEVKIVIKLDGTGGETFVRVAGGWLPIPGAGVVPRDEREMPLMASTMQR